MADDKEEEAKPLLLSEDQDQLYPDIPPPPAYEPVKKPVVMETALPLPTYEQSEKYEKDGVLDYNDQLEGSIRIVSQQTSDRSSGTTCDFAIFFLVCFLFSWIGYLLSCCLATTVAAQSGAAAGLGLSLVAKTIFVEFQPNYLTNMAHSMCNDGYYIYDHNTVIHHCTNGYYTFVRLFFWVLGFLGLFLFARGLSVFCQSRSQRRQLIEVSSA